MTEPLEGRTPENSQTQACRDCGVTKPYEAFVKRSKGGRLTRCKACQNAYARQRRADKAAKDKQAQRLERAAMMERLWTQGAPRIAAQRRDYYEGVEAHYQRHGTYRTFPAKFLWGVPVEASGPMMVSA